MELTWPKVILVDFFKFGRLVSDPHNYEEIIFWWVTRKAATDRHNDPLPTYFSAQQLKQVVKYHEVTACE